jgi:hypothetical protein
MFFTCSALLKRLRHNSARVKNSHIIPPSILRIGTARSKHGNKHPYEFMPDYFEYTGSVRPRQFGET